MPVNLPDLPQAVAAYLANGVTVTVGAVAPTAGQVINPGETFTFRVTASNAPAPSGIALTNVRYLVSVDRASGATIRVPSAGTAIDGQGQPIAPNSNVTFFNFNPSGDDPSYLQIGEADSLPPITGTAGPNAGTVTITARIQADPDINALFPRNFNSTGGSRNVSVVGT